jgi:hypothetical protein
VFIADGEPYTDPYRTGIPDGLRAVAVGWLEPGHAYAQGPSDETFVSLLFEACTDHATARMRGWHGCGFCVQTGKGDAMGSLTFSRDGRAAVLGDAEIRVVAEDGKVFVAPTLILHYVVEHSYQPPGEFVQAVSRGERQWVGLGE